MVATLHSGMALSMLPPELFPLLHGPDGRVLLRVQRLVLRADRSRDPTVRMRFEITTPAGGRPIEVAVVGLRQKSRPFLLKGEVWLSSGRYRIARAEEGYARTFSVFEEPTAPLRIFCGHGRAAPSRTSLLGAFSPAGEPFVSIKETLLHPCCGRGKNPYRTPGRRLSTRSLGLLQALSRPLVVTLRGKPIAIDPGAAFVINRDDVTPIAEAQPFPLHFRHVAVASSTVDRFMAATGLGPQAKKLLFDPVPRPNPPAVSGALALLEDALLRPEGPAQRAHLETCLNLFLFSLLRDFPNKIASAARRRKAAAHDDPRLARAIEYLAAHYARPYDRDTLARYACVSRQRLQELFHLHLRTDPRSYLQRIRMDKAKALLAAGKMSFAEVGRSVGFRTSRGFKRFYRRQTAKDAAR